MLREQETDGNLNRCICGASFCYACGDAKASRRDECSCDPLSISGRADLGPMLDLREELDLIAARWSEDARHQQQCYQDVAQLSRGEVLGPRARAAIRRQVRNFANRELRQMSGLLPAKDSSDEMDCSQVVKCSDERFTMVLNIVVALTFVLTLLVAIKWLWSRLLSVV